MGIFRKLSSVSTLEKVELRSDEAQIQLMDQQLDIQQPAMQAQVDSVPLTGPGRHRAPTPVAPR